jgi:hypothetical protein
MSLPPGRNLFAEYPNKYGIESGTWRGDGVAAFLEAGFEHIRTIDIDPEAAIFCSNRFWLTKNTHLDIKCFTGDSAEMLWEMIKDIQESMTVFLDAHWQFFENEDPGPNPFPLLKELEQIGRHPIKTHTLIVDDWHIFYRDRVGYSKNDVKNAILQINPAYKFTMAANPIIDGILIAHL